MGPVRRAVIDVGTNSIKLLVADVAGHDVRPVREESKQTRLGRGFYKHHRLQEAAIAATASAVAEFVATARAEQAASIRVIATSAAREAVNAPELTSAIEAAAGIKAHIISGEQEAEWVFQGVTTDPGLAKEPLLLLDVGGGSTEFILGGRGHRQFQRSVPLGTVRLLETIPHSDPPKPEELASCRHWLKEFLGREVEPWLKPALPEAAGRHLPKGEQSSRASGAGEGKGAVLLVGTGGTASILGCMEAELATFDRQRLEATPLSRERLHWHVQRLWSLPLEARKEIVGLPRNRADVILTGTVIYEAIMQHLGFTRLRISTRGLRFGAVLAAQT
jgi:exopolyphosphatase/guanosine-5'-triphosphate,3'-diphosphate pyrophosphatase